MREGLEDSRHCAATWPARSTDIHSAPSPSRNAMPVCAARPPAYSTVSSYDSDSESPEPALNVIEISFRRCPSSNRSRRVPSQEMSFKPIQVLKNRQNSLKIAQNWACDCVARIPTPTGWRARTGLRVDRGVLQEFVSRACACHQTCAVVDTCGVQLIDESL